MNTDQPLVLLSAIEEEHLGVRTARASGVTLNTLPEVMSFCRANKVVLLVARCLASEFGAVHAMEREGFLLMDTLIYYSRDLVDAPRQPRGGNIRIRPMRAGEERIVRNIAAESFRGYLGHYHADERIDRSKCDEAYESWAYRSCVSRDIVDEVLVAELNGSVAAFATFRINSPEEVEGLLSGVSPSARGRGIHGSLLTAGMVWCLSKGATRMVFSTQITNIAAQKIWVRLGAEPSHAYYTFHKWFDGPTPSQRPDHEAILDA